MLKPFTNILRPLAHAPAAPAQTAGRPAARPGSFSPDSCTRSRRLPRYWRFSSALVCALTLPAQTKMDIGRQARDVDFSGASLTKPSRMGASLPSTCSQGETYFLTTAQPGSNLYVCASTNNWSAPAASGGAGIPYTGAAADVDLGSHGLKAAFIDTSAGGPTRIDLLTGTCPSTASSGMDSTVCLEAGILYQVNSAGVKSMLAPVFGASGSSHAAGLVPDPGSNAGAVRFLREDGAWQTPSGSGSGGSSSLTFASAAVSAAAASPAGVWMLNAGSGNSLADSSGNSNPVTAGGTVGWSAGPGRCNPGPCAHFPGTFDSPSANHTNFNPGSSQPFSVAFWTSFDAVGSADTPLSQVSPGTNHPGWQIQKLAGGSGAYTDELQFVLTDAAGGSAQVAFYPPMTAGFLHHFVFSADGTHTAAGLTAWMDGQRMVVQGLLSDSLSGDMTPNANIQLGDVIGLARHVGYLAGVHLYSRVLTQAEVLPLYYAGPTTDTFTQATRTSTTVTASGFAAQDADCGTGLKLGGGTATDNTDKLNAVLLTASAAAPLDLVLDGPGCALTTGLHMAQTGYTTIRGTGWESGIFVKPLANAPAITNDWGMVPNFPMPARGLNVEVSNLRLNCNMNGSAFPTGSNSSIVDPRGSPWIYCLAVAGIDNIKIDRVWVQDSPTFGINLTNDGFVTVSNGKVTETLPVANTDAIHVDGTVNNVWISNEYLQAGDDLIALNAPEGHSGDITSVTIDGIEAAGTSAASLVRMYSAMTDSMGLHRGAVKNVTVSNCTGTAGNNGAFIFGNQGPMTEKDWLQNIFITNVRMAAPSFMHFDGERVGDVKVSNSAWIPTAANPAIYMTGVPLVNNIALNNFSIYRNADGNAAGWLLTVPSSAAINRLELNGVSVLNEIGSSYSALPYLIDVPSGGSIGRLWVSSSDPLNITAPFSGAGESQITHVVGPGVTAAGMSVK